MMRDVKVIDRPTLDVRRVDVLKPGQHRGHVDRELVPDAFNALVGLGEVADRGVDVCEERRHRARRALKRHVYVTNIGLHAPISIP